MPVDRRRKSSGPRSARLPGERPAREPPRSRGQKVLLHRRVHSGGPRGRSRARAEDLDGARPRRARNPAGAVRGSGGTAPSSSPC